VTAARPELIRSIGRWALAGLVINGVIGSAIFGMPSLIAARLGRAAPWAWIMAALLIGVVVACFAEVASRFREAGGPYLYARATFGRFAGIQTGWMAYLARLTASASVAATNTLGPASARLKSGSALLRGPYQAGIWWPHQSWREMHQSWMFSSQWL